MSYSLQGKTWSTMILLIPMNRWVKIVMIILILKAAIAIIQVAMINLRNQILHLVRCPIVPNLRRRSYTSLLIPFSKNTKKINRSNWGRHQEHKFEYHTLKNSLNTYANMKLKRDHWNMTKVLALVIFEQFKMIYKKKEKRHKTSWRAHKWIYSSHQTKKSREAALIITSQVIWGRARIGCWARSLLIWFNWSNHMSIAYPTKQPITLMNKISTYLLLS